jgi:hypothetical protein
VRKLMKMGGLEQFLRAVCVLKSAEDHQEKGLAALLTAALRRGGFL